jgi:hypothetical protein
MSIGKGKHIVFSDDENVNPERKRRRLEDREAIVEIADIRSPESLKKILAFQQDATSRMRQSMFIYSGLLNCTTYKFKQIFRLSRSFLTQSCMVAKVPTLRGNLIYSLNTCNLRCP